MQIPRKLQQKILYFSTFCAKEVFFRGRPQKRKKSMNKKVLKQKKSKKRKRFENRKCKIISKSVKVFAANAAGIRCKTKSFEHIISSIKPQIWMLQETKLQSNEKIKCEAANDFQIFYLNRQKSQGGGLALGIEKNIESTLIREGDDDIGVMSIQTVLGGIPTRIVVGYGPQENKNFEEDK